MSISRPRSFRAAPVAHLQRELLEAGDEEKRKAGHELHNEIAQQLVGISFLLKGLKQKLLTQGKEEAQEMELAETELNQAAKQVMALARRLTPLEMAGDDFVSSIKELAVQAQTLHSINCFLKIEGNPPPLKKRQAWQLHNIIRSALGDALTEDKASNACISVASSPSRLILILRNNGIIFPSLTAWSAGKNLSIINHRAHSIGAFLELTPRRRGGTILICVLPIRE